jgi:transcriptional regulator, XRE family
LTKPKITIAELRARNKKMTQKELAELVGVSTQTVIAWEKDITTIKADNLLKLCSVLNTSATELLGI